MGELIEVNKAAHSTMAMWNDTRYVGLQQVSLIQALKENKSFLDGI